MLKIKNKKYNKLKELFVDSEKMDLSTFNSILLCDPTTKTSESNKKEKLFNRNDFKGECEFTYIGKYSNWLIRVYLNSNYKDLFIEDLYKTNGDLIIFHKNKHKLENKDINSIGNLNDLYKLIKPFISQTSLLSKNERKKLKIKEGCELLHDTDNFTVIRIVDKGDIGHEAAKFYGGYHVETRWCTATNVEHYFKEDYAKDDLYIILNNKCKNVGSITKLPEERYQFYFKDNMFMDKDDLRININEFIKENPELVTPLLDKIIEHKILRLTNFNTININEYNYQIYKHIGFKNIGELFDNSDYYHTLVIDGVDLDDLNFIENLNHITRIFLNKTRIEYSKLNFNTNIEYLVLIDSTINNTKNIEDNSPNLKLVREVGVFRNGFHNNNKYKYINI